MVSQRGLEWETIEYITANSEILLYAWLDTIPSKSADKVNEDIARLELFGLRWGMPHVRKLDEHIWELRTKTGSDIYCVLMFRWHKTTLVLTHGFTKKQNKTPPQEIVRAERHRTDWINRKGV
ncbi:type II toxin-antitoxin system RelE/ParE family toxin [Sporolactobacillus sp. Y61]|uniref:Type II toxin-antitoxin system RelE/ParE family toxin n=1 Tax=Sporolactobacillus sp. Y61 TaxID=3160863 RepID=A0AAU8IHT5_9BACL